MQQILSVRSEIYSQFHSSTAAKSLQGDDFAAYYTSMYLIQDTGEAVQAHMDADFSAGPMRAYLEFWGVMQAIFIQQDAICELHRVIAKAKPAMHPNSAWAKLRDVRNLCAGHPASRTFGVPVTQRTFMGRSFGNYNRITYELWEASGTRTHPVFNLRQMVQDYDSEAAQVLRSVLTEMAARWP